MPVKNLSHLTWPVTEARKSWKLIKEELSLYRGFAKLLNLSGSREVEPLFPSSPEQQKLEVLFDFFNKIELTDIIILLLGVQPNDSIFVYVVKRSAQ